MIRILHITMGMTRGGIETFIMNVYRKIDREKVQFDFLVHTSKECDYDREIIEMGGRIFSVPPRNKGLSKNIKALKEFFQKHSEYKIVHQHVSSLTYVTPLKIAKSFGIPTRIIHSHSTAQGGSSLHYYFHKYNQLNVQSFATDYFACSEMAALWLYGNKQVRDGKYEIINNGIEIEDFKFSEEVRHRKRQELGVKEKYVVGHIGRLNPVKNHTFLIDVFYSIYQENKQAILLLIGEGRLRKELEDKVNELGIEKNVIFTGVRSDISALLQAMDVFVFPSHYEGLGMVAVEAQASGLPCIVSDRVPSEVAVTSDIKFLSLNDSVEKWKESILGTREMFQREDTSEFIKNNGYNIQEVAQKMEDFYRTKNALNFEENYYD